MHYSKNIMSITILHTGYYDTRENKFTLLHEGDVYEAPEATVYRGEVCYLVRVNGKMTYIPASLVGTEPLYS